MKKTSNQNKKRNLISIVSIITFSIFLFLSCKKEKGLLPNSYPSETQFTISKSVNASIQGTVFLEDGSPASNANVRIGSYNTITNEEGFFVFNKIYAPEKHAHLIVSVDGYFVGHHTITLMQGATEFTQIRLLKKELTTTFDSKIGATVNVNGGGKLNFGANSIVYKSNNQNYSGNVKVFSKWIDPNGEFLYELTPGCLRGITTANTETNLMTYGMMAVELFDENGVALQLKTGTSADIIYPIAQNLLSSAPATCPLWYLDEKIGIWKEEGSLTKQGNEYVGKVNHFTFWNADIPGLVDFTVELRDSITNLPLSNKQVKLTDLTNTFMPTSYGYTNSLGIVTGGVRPNSNFKIQVIENCSNNINILKTDYFSSAAVNYNYGIMLVDIPPASSASITGTIVDGNNNIIPNAQLTIKVNGSYSTLKLRANAQGVFSYLTSICSNSLSIDIVAYDSITKHNSGSINYVLTNGTQNVGNINADVKESEFIEISTNDNGLQQTFALVEPNANFNIFYNTTSSILICNSFSNLPSIDWSVNFKVAGPTGIGVNSNNLSSHYDKFNGVNTYTYSIVSGLPVTFTEYGSLIGSFIKGRYNVNYVSPNNNKSRTINFNIKRDFN